MVVAIKMVHILYTQYFDALVLVLPTADFTEEKLELLLFAVKDLRNSLKDLGSDLMIRSGRTESVIQDLVK